MVRDAARVKYNFNLFMIELNDINDDEKIKELNKPANKKKKKNNQNNNINLFPTFTCGMRSNKKHHNLHDMMKLRPLN